jgi:hypothetical protein
MAIHLAFSRLLTDANKDFPPYRLNQPFLSITLKEAP